LKRQLPTRTIRHTILITESAPTDVYKAFLSSKEHSAFTGSPAKCTSRAGGTFTAWGDYISGKNIKLVKDKQITQEWKTSEWPEGYGPSILNISLKPNRSSTELKMVQSKVPASQYSQYNTGWYESYWDPMKKYFSEKASRRQRGLRKETKR
jgi:activator of HSP90 ATPase